MKTVTIELSKEMEHKLHTRAKAEGRDLASAALEILERDLRESVLSENPNDLPYEVWRERFDAWVNSHPKVDVVIDDSRESIYEGRGE